MEVSIQLPVYAIAIVGSFPQFPFAQIFKFLEGYDKDVERPHPHNEINDIKWAWWISLFSWIICIICVGIGLSLYLVEPLIGKYLEDIIGVIIGVIFLLLCISSLAAIMSILNRHYFL